MKIWDLEKESDRFIRFILEGREKRKTSIRAAVEEIKKAVLLRKGAALIEFSRRWDGWEEDHPLKVPEREINEALAGIPRADLPVLRGMIKNVRAFHRTQKGRARTYKGKGLTVKEEFVPVERAMVYVPGGTAPYPSSVPAGSGLVVSSLEDGLEAGVRELA